MRWIGCQSLDFTPADPRYTIERLGGLLFRPDQPETVAADPETAARKLRDSRQRADLAQTQTGEDNEIA